MRILVTGGAGYIGSITTRVLLDAGHECVVLDTLEKGHREAIDPRAVLVEGDVGDGAALDVAMPGCDAVMHLAGYIEVAESQSEPERYFRNNSVKPRVMLRSMVYHGVQSIVFSSTAAVYGEPESVPITEDARTNPVSAYGASKLAFETELESYAYAHGIREVRLRYFNVAGAWEDGSLGEAHDPESHLIPRVLRAMAAGQDRFEVFGDDYDTPDGTCVRDYIHVCDLARAHQIALEHPGAGGAPGTGGVFNLGNGKGYSNLGARCPSSSGAGARGTLPCWWRLPSGRVPGSAGSRSAGRFERS
jgi:UDP-glucose 4-epimerase